jgi:hypothetical protein
MNLIASIFFYTVILIITLLTGSVIYMIFSYRKLLKDYSDLEMKIKKIEADKELKIETNRLVGSLTNQKVQSMVGKATDDALDLIEKKTVERLMQEETAEKNAIQAKLDEAKVEIEKFKTQEFETIRKRAHEVLVKIMPNILTNALSQEEQEKIITSELENAKRSNLF